MTNSGIDYRDCVTGEDECAYLIGANRIPGPHDREKSQNPPPMAAPDNPGKPIEADD